jgi:glycerophosphoryl diester phosphodiesterase
MVQSFWEITSNSYFKYLRSFGVVGIGPWKDNVDVPDANNYLEVPSDIVTRAHKYGLQVPPHL